ncbi:hypothetical protein EUGRSUZ_I01188 [Eucalyptus grandis]|uniref:Uncharacterized protein n=2 Tax=Eucalyptus grandis TaxID=71139 RepID=A0ACC3JDY0_EUCGR|nr:hypothetical protein EUGRSUZ_I01188 [Eucalyptus grandis]
MISPEEASLESKHFVLFHGSRLSAGCWYKIVRLLRSSGHKVTALDLVSSAKSLQLIFEYFKPLRDVMEGLASHERVILADHIPKKIALAVFVTALMPGLELSVSTPNQEGIAKSLINSPLYFTSELFEKTTTGSTDHLRFWPNFLSSNVYQLSPIERVRNGVVLMLTWPKI